MKLKTPYTAPHAEIISLETEYILCSSLGFGEEGAPGMDFLDEDDILDGGSF